MPIRMTGMASGMDTEAMVSELVSAYRLKSQKYRKAQTKLSWKQDQWKAMNTKIKSLHTTLGNMKLSTAYNSRLATVSDATKATVGISSGAKPINGTYNLKIISTAKTGYITGGQVNSSIKKDSTLADLGITDTGKISVKTGDGTITDIEVTSGMKVSEFVSKLGEAGLEANFDEANHRFYVAAKATGTASDFSLSGTDNAGADALLKLGLSVESEANMQNYKEWAKYAVNTDGNAYVSFDSTGTAVFNGTYDADKTKTKVNDIVTKLRDSSAIYTNDTAQIAYAKAYKSVSDTDARLTESERDEMLAWMDEADIANVYTDASGDLYDLQPDGTVKSRVDDSIHNIDDLSLTKGTERLLELQEKAGLATKETKDDGSVVYTLDEAAFSAYKNNRNTIAVYENEPDNADEVANVEAAYAAGSLDTLVTSLQTGVDEAKQYIEDYKLFAGDTQTVDSMTEKITNAAGILDGTIPKRLSPGATRVDGKDAKILLNGAEYTSTKNDFSINGLNISALAETGTTDITITVANNTQGTYDKIKSFLKQYNTIINEMTASYNAPTTKGYEPLTSEEKEAMSDKEVEEWEKKLKDSSLRRDDTLEYFLSNLQGAMMKSYEIDGKKYSLSSFGISTLGILKAENNEENAFHIDGDKDDALTSDNTDKLMTALMNNTEVVTEFFQKLSTDTYKVINDKIGSTKLKSFGVFYNDKEMAQEYSDYTTTIKKWDDKLAEIEESYYKKFTAMEKALASLQSQQSSLSGLLGS